MTGSQLPENWQDLIAGYVLGDLSSEEVEVLQRVLVDNPEIVAELDAYQETLALLPYVLPQNMPSPDLGESIFQTAEASRPIFPTTPVPLSVVSGQNYRKSWGLMGLAAAIAAAAILILAIDNNRLRQQVAESQWLRQQLQEQQATIQKLQQDQQRTRGVLAALQQRNALVYSLEGAGQLTNAFGNLVTVPGHRQMILVFDNLPKLPEGKVYRFWAATADSLKPMYCGQFNGNSTGTVQWAAPKALCTSHPTEMMITVDAITDSTKSWGPLVMQSKV
jgi:anti-sigma-K factor RskA